MNALTIIPDNPAEIGYSPTLPVEIVLKTAPLKDICAAYKITKEDWDQLRVDPRFIADIQATTELLKKEGMSFRMKARLQSEELLKTSWKMIHSTSDEVPPMVRADLIKFIIRCAGLVEDPKAQAAQVPLNIQINLG